jgi:hypothetical protein
MTLKKERGDDIILAFSAVLAASVVSAVSDIMHKEMKE